MTANSRRFGGSPGWLGPLILSNVPSRVVAHVKHRGKTVVWDRYERWNGAIAGVVFSPDHAGVPVYLDLEDDVIASVAAVVGEQSEEPEAALVADVAATIDGGASQAGILRAHALRVRQWEQGDRIGTPPHLALLAVMSLAAERMANGEGMSANNYYGRLAPMLGMPDRQLDLAQAYRRVAERWWNDLNLWLERHDGRRGLPTAYSLGALQHRYVGLPISQALVRAADRQGLVRFFQRLGFAAGSDVPPHALTPLLDAWIRQNPSPATRSLQRMWSKPATRERVAEVAAVALAAWDGTVSGRRGDGGAADENLRLVATVGGFLRPRLEVGVLAYLERPEEARDVRVLTAEGDPAVTALPTSIGAMRLAGIERADLGSLLDGVLTIEDSLTGRVTSRRPRRIVPFRQHDLLLQLVEADQVQAGEDIVLLVENSLLAKLEAMLGEVARPGWRVAGSELSGVPPRWTVVRDVQVLRAPAVSPPDDLKSLIPLTQSQLTLAGGFGIPGRLRRWHSWQPPEIRALDDSGELLHVRVIGIGGTDDLQDDEAEPVVAQWSSDVPGALIVDLEQAGLDDGDYRVELRRGTEDAPRTSLVLRLRSADVPDMLQWQQAPELGSASGVPLSVLSAVGLAGPGPWVRGAAAPPAALGTMQENQPDPPPSRPWWEGAAPPVPINSDAWRVAAADPTSCMFTGRHIWLVPATGPGKPAERFVFSTCNGCGLVQREVTTAWAARKRAPRTPTVCSVTPLDVARVESVRSEGDDRWTVALDALGYLGGGAYGLLEKVALQVEASALFVDHFIRTLETLGHIEVERDAATLDRIAWEIAPTTLAETVDRRWSLAGYWPGSITRALQRVVEDAGGGLVHETSPAGPQCWFVQMPDGVDLPDVSDVGEIAVVPDAAQAISSILLPMSDLVEALPRRSADMVGDVTIFSPVGARWVRSDVVGPPGAYRVRKWAVTDVIRTESDVRQGTAALSTVQLAKHAAAAAYGRPLLSYDQSAHQLVVPLGADLPGLYGRAAALASGRPPRVDLSRRRLVYDDVPQVVAVAIARCLSN